MATDLTLKLLIQDLVQFRAVLGTLAGWTVWARERPPCHLDGPEAELLAAVDALMARKDQERR